jgi:argininosuccinate lyase
MHIQPPESDHPTGTFCERTAEEINSLKQAIKIKEGEIENQREYLSELQRQPNPDPERIQEIMSGIQELEDELEADREQLNVLEEEFHAECSP